MGVELAFLVVHVDTELAADAGVGARFSATARQRAHPFGEAARIGPRRVDLIGAGGEPSLELDLVSHGRSGPSCGRGTVRERRGGFPRRHGRARATGALRAAAPDSG